MIICIAEDREWCEAPVKLLLLSLREHCPDMSVELFYPPADAAFIQWLQQFPQVNLNTQPLEGAGSWNVKPHALLQLMQRGYEEILWIDADVIVTHDFRTRFDDLAHDTLCVTEDALQSGNREDNEPPRALSWGFQLGRSLPFAANTAVLRVTTAHRTLIQRWRELLASAPYQAAQRLKSGRPSHMFGDQDVLTALLASTEFAAIPVKFLRRGRDIIHYFSYHGYTCAERLGNLIRGMPPFIHSQVNKPWAPRERERIPFEPGRLFWIKCLTCIYLDASPYALTAEKYRAQIEDDVSWIAPRTPSGKVLRLLGCGHPALVGFPVAALTDCIRLRKRLKQAWRAWRADSPSVPGERTL